MSCLIPANEYVSENFNLIGRGSDIERISSVLMRYSANNIILFGTGGAGCSAILKGLHSVKKNLSNIPFDVANKQLFWLDVDALFSNSNRDVIADNFSNMDSILRKTPDSVLIIDNTIGFIQGAKTNGCENMINTVMSSIQSGHYQCIFETHDKSIGQVMSMHSNILDFFTLIEVDEPTDEELPLIVTEACKSITEHHMISVGDDAIDMAITLTSKYRGASKNLSKAQPECTISLIDLAMSEFRKECHSDISEKDKKSLTDIFESRARSTVFMNKLNSDLITAASAAEDDNRKPEDTREYCRIRDQISDAEKIMKSEMNNYRNITKEINKDFILSKDQVLVKFSELSKISKDRLTEDEGQKLMMLEDNMKSDVFSQDETIHKICNAVKASRVGLTDQNKPDAVFMLMGASGVGKTYITKRLAYYLYGSESSMLRFDMSEYMEKHSVSKLIGAPAGYDGYENGGLLTNAVKKNPHTIILFDEVEKAHASIFDVFLQMLDDGRLTDNHGVTVDFSNTIIIMTTNEGQSEFLDSAVSHEAACEIAMNSLEERFRPEFLNRIAGRENIIGCNTLDLETIIKIADVELKKANKRLSSRDADISLFMKDEDVKGLCKNRYKIERGARSVSGVFEAEVYPHIANHILEGKGSGKVSVNYNEKTNKLELAA